MTYTFRGVHDAELQGRIAEILPMLQAMMEACEDRHAARQVAREAAKAAQAQPVPPQASTPAALQHLVQQAVQHALTAQANDQAVVAAANGPTSEEHTSLPPQAPPTDTSEGYCAIHLVWMEQRSDDRGAW